MSALLVPTGLAGIAGALPASLTETGAVGPGETVLFWVVAPLMVIAALGLVFARKAAYSAISLVAVMLCLSVIYIAQQAPFLGVVQIVVYTGAIIMLFLFVLMLIGVDASDSLLETIKGQRWIAALGALGLVLVLGAVIVTAAYPQAVGLDAVNAVANPGADPQAVQTTGGPVTNVTGVALLLFSEHVAAIQLSGALLVVAALGAQTLTHRQRTRPVLDQRATAEAKMRAYAESGVRPNQAAAPGVYARSTSATVPALSATGAPVLESVTQVLRIRGQVTPIGDISPETVEAVATQQAGHEGQVMHGGAASRSITQSGVPGMRGVGAPVPAGLAEQQRAARAELGLDEDTDAARIESGESQK